MSVPYLGDILPGQTIDFMWNSNSGAGASITRATNGTISVYKGNDTTQTTTGVTDTEDFDTLTGVHHVRIVTTNAFYVAGENYMVVLSGATIDGQTVNAVLAHFSILNRGVDKVSIRGTVDNTAFTATASIIEADDITEATADHYNGREIMWTSGALLGQRTTIEDYAINGGRGRFTVTTMTEAPADNDTFQIL